MSQEPAIFLDRVTRYYGRRPGIVDLSASIERGQLVGLLGPNGAGKTTTIRILTCYMPPTSGTARICGFDVFSASLHVRQRLGYLPENCPLYPEMRTQDYLRWIAELKGMSRDDAQRAVYKVVDPCGIEHALSRRIGALSKGFRQRVGLASVLLHDPEVLILDEPTVGLDPLQVREFRSLLAQLRGKHTVLLSSHILSEIELICDSVVIVNEGRAVAVGTPDALRGGVEHTYHLECRAHPSLPIVLPRILERQPGLVLAALEEDNGTARATLRAAADSDPREALLRQLSEAGIAVLELCRSRVTLEDVFVHYTRKQKVAGESSGEPS